MISLKKGKGSEIYGVFGGCCKNGQILPEMEFLMWEDEKTDEQDEQQLGNTRMDTNST